MTWKHVSTAAVLPVVVGLEKPARVVSEQLPVRLLFVALRCSFRHPYP